LFIDVLNSARRSWTNSA